MDRWPTRWHQQLCVLLPHFSVSIAVRMNGRTEVACAYDPMPPELFTAQRGAGAQLNNAQSVLLNLKTFKVLFLLLVFRSSKTTLESFMKIITGLFVDCVDFRQNWFSSSWTYVISGWPCWRLPRTRPLSHGSSSWRSNRSWSWCYHDWLAGGTDYMTSGNVVASSARGVKSILKHVRENSNEGMLK